MQQRFFRMRDLATLPGREGKPARAGRYPVVPSTIWRWVRRGEFPEPVSLAGGTTAWRAAEIEAWDAARAGAGNRAEHLAAAGRASRAKHCAKGGLL